MKTLLALPPSPDHLPPPPLPHALSLASIKEFPSIEADNNKRWGTFAGRRGKERKRSPDMVYYREAGSERPPLSLILPHLYLGAERDVTQESLSSRGISYVLSVSRCSPQPAFLPVSRYLRIPIDDSLRDDLLPWIPSALRFIDGAMSSGGAVLVHCAAGISRSPALAVAYIMYSLGLDLDHAYRFVKERRPSISPNFNFLGQLQHFQGSLGQKSSDGSLVIQPLDSPNTNHSNQPTSPLPCPLPSPSPGLDYQGNRLPGGGDDAGAVTRVERPMHTEEAAQRCVRWGEVPKNPSEAARSLSGKLLTLNLTLNLNQNVRTPLEPSSPCREPTAPVPKPAAPLQLPTGHASLLDRRKSLTLSLSATVSTPTPTPTPSKQQATTPQTEAGVASIPGRQTAHVGSAAQNSDPPAGGVSESAAPEARGQTERSASSSSCRKSTRPGQGSPQGPAPPGRAVGGRGQGKGKGKRAGGCAPSQAQKPSQKTGSRKEVRRGEVARRQRNNTNTNTNTNTTTTNTTNTTTTTTIVDQQPSKTSSTLDPEETVVEDQSPLSPLNLTINKLLGWGERMLLGVLLGPQIKMGQAALPYRC
ncbi:Dual specificity protein phosphatase 8 [Merluccius polli]|uniref:protein-tyrosine-phosphatase n=1 Tax=Merluccius polli TaxID=89951 RepID=A0AA47P9S6_MERPO|nr:Dual specificity protein phosphatase 8 [Merluccius polli]